VRLVVVEADQLLIGVVCRLSGNAREVVAASRSYSPSAVKNG
jgi:hypothetical protein